MFNLIQLYYCFILFFKDGSYLAELLLSKGYEVCDVKINNVRIYFVSRRHLCLKGASPNFRKQNFCYFGNSIGILVRLYRCKWKFK